MTHKLDTGYWQLDTIIGQDKALEILTNVIRSEKVAQAYIFHGPAGVGKLLTAFTIAKVLNCKNDEKCPYEDTPQTQLSTINYPLSTINCHCPSCTKIDQHQHPDVKFYFPIPNFAMDENGVVKSDSEWEQYQKYIETKQVTPHKDYQWDKATAIRIEQIRALQRDIAMAKHEAKKKVYIIEDFDKLTNQATNAFLKTLEEPPPDTLFILTTTAINRLLPTILSRCSAIEFYPIAAECIETYLIQKLHTPLDKARLYSRLANGDLAKAICLHTDENLETMDITLSFLRIALQNDDIAFLQWLDTHFAKNTKNTDTFGDFIKYLYLWLNDIQLYTLKPDAIVFVNQTDLLSQYTTHKPHISERLSTISKKLDDYLIKYTGNVNPKLILSQIYNDFEPSL